MGLAARLSAFFLVALAVVLVGFSLALFVLARVYLYRQVDERLSAALDTLAAAAEVEPEGVEWEPHEHHLTLGQGDGADAVGWVVQDDRGNLVDHSNNLTSGELATSPLSIPLAGPQEIRLVYHEGQPWRVKQRQLRAGLPDGRTASMPAGPDHDDPPGAPEPRRFPSLLLTGGVSLAPVQATLRTLAVVLTGLSLFLWLAAALLGRRLCKRALVPVVRMAAAARAMSAADLNQRLPSPQTGDELEDLGSAFNNLVGRLQEAFERQRRFTGDASHQLRTPLAALLGQVEVALRRDRPPDDYRHVLARVYAQAEHLHRIVEMLLFLARADADSRLPDLEAMDLAGWLPGYLGTGPRRERVADFRVEAPPGQPLWVRAQGPLLGQFLDNLLDNACKYSRPGTPVLLRLGHEAGSVTLTVEDRGLGIDPEDLPHVFEPFYRSPRARGLGVAGVGLGLAVSQRIAAAFGGTLEVQSEPGRGSRFTLRLPAVTAPAPPTGARTG
jgi:signal transduction histidine kinase